MRKLFIPDEAINKHDNIVAIMLISFEFKTPKRVQINLYGSVWDILANAVLSIPLLWLGGRLSMGEK